MYLAPAGRHVYSYTVPHHSLAPAGRHLCKRIVLFRPDKCSSESGNEPLHTSRTDTDRKMKSTTFYLLLAALLGITAFLSFAQQNQNTQKPNPEIEALKKRILTLESKLQTVENVEKMELAAKLAEANSKLRNAEFSKFERELKDANDGWLMKWNGFFLGVLAVIGVALWFSVKSLIADRIEKSLNGFKEAVAQVDTLKNELMEAVGQVNILQDQIRLLKIEHTASVLENFMNTSFDGFTYPQSIEALREEVLLQVFDDEEYRLPIRHKAGEVLADRRSERLVSPALKLLNLVVGLNLEGGKDYWLCDLPNFLEKICTPEAYQGLKEFLNRLLTENLKRKDWFLTRTVISLAYVIPN